VVAVTNRVQLALRVPVNDVERYESYLRENHVQKHPYAGTKLERGLRTLRGDNDLVALGDEIDRVLRAAGRRPTDDREKNTLTRSVSDGPTKPVNYRIDPEVRRWFVHTYDEPGRVAGQLMRHIADGGTVARLLRRFQRVADDAEDLLADLAGGGSPGAVKRRTRTLCQLLTHNSDGFPRDDFVATLDSPDVEGIDASDHTRNKYLPKVLDRLNYLPHPDNPDLFLPESKARDFGADPDGPAIDLWAPDDLTEDELIQGLRIELARDAATGNGRGAYTAAEARTDVFDGRLSRRKVSSLMDSAATADGFRTKSDDDGKRIVALLSKIGDDVRKHVGDDGMDTPSSRPGRHNSQQDSKDADQSDATSGVRPGDTDDPGDVNAEIDALMNATPVTDGGSDG
jgi:hypothetical protein